MKKFSKKAVGIVAALSVLTTMPASAVEIETYSEDLSVYYNGTNVYAESQYKPIIVNDRTMVQIKPIFEMMGFESEYDESTKRATFSNDEGVVKYSFIVGDSNIYKTDFLSEHVTIPGTMDVPAIIHNDTFYVPLRAFCETLGMGIEWLDTERTVLVTGASEQPKYENTSQPAYENIVSDHFNLMGTWYYAYYSDPSYDDFKPIEIKEYGENQAIIDWGNGETNIIEFTSDSDAKGAYLEIGEAHYYFGVDYDGYEFFNVEPVAGGRIFQSGAGGYRIVPDYYKK